MTTSYSVWDYNLITEFNKKQYDKVLQPMHICDSEKLITKYKDENGEECELNERVYPMKKDRTNFLLPRQYLNELPVRPDGLAVISLNRDVYYLLLDRTPCGLRPEKTFSSVKEFIDQFCDYDHSSPIDAILLKIFKIIAYIKRINIRVSTEPACGKDSVSKVSQLLNGDIGIVHNPTMAKIEYLLNNKVLVTNEVAGISGTEKSNLEQYYLCCGDFSAQYEKRSVANYKGALNTYDISNLSNIVYYNNIDCYPTKTAAKYFDNTFQRAVLERFLPFKLRGRITEKFGEVLGAKDKVQENILRYKNTVKMFKYLEESFENELHGYTDNVSHDFRDRYLRNWKTILLMCDAYCETQEQFDILTQELYERHTDYNDMIDEHKTEELVIEKENKQKKEETLSLNAWKV